MSKKIQKICIKKRSPVASSMWPYVGLNILLDLSAVCPIASYWGSATKHRQGIELNQYRQPRSAGDMYACRDDRIHGKIANDWEIDLKFRYWYGMDISYLEPYKLGRIGLCLPETCSYDDSLSLAKLNHYQLNELQFGLPSERIQTAYLDYLIDQETFRSDYLDAVFYKLLYKI